MTAPIARCEQCQKGNGRIVPGPGSQRMRCEHCGYEWLAPSLKPYRPELTRTEAAKIAGKKPYTLYCSRCGGRVRWRLVIDAAFDPAAWWSPPLKCSHCGVKALKGETISTTILD